MNKKQAKAIEEHKKCLSRLTDTQARNLMEHAANETPLIPADGFRLDYIDCEGRC